MYLIMYFLLIFLGIYDVVSTKLVLYYGGIELNPIMDGFIQYDHGVFFKLLITVSISLYLLIRKSYTGFIVANSIMLVVAIINTVSLLIQFNV